jgi:hypothetical protein
MTIHEFEIFETISSCEIFLPLAVVHSDGMIWRNDCRSVLGLLDDLCNLRRLFSFKVEGCLAVEGTKYQSDGKNCVLKSFMISALCQIWSSNAVGWDQQSIQFVRVGKKYTYKEVFGLETYRKKTTLGDPCRIILKCILSNRMGRRRLDSSGSA